MSTGGISTVLSQYCPTIGKELKIWREGQGVDVLEAIFFPQLVSSSTLFPFVWLLLADKGSLGTSWGQHRPIQLTSTHRKFFSPAIHLLRNHTSLF